MNVTRRTAIGIRNRQRGLRTYWCCDDTSLHVSEGGLLGQPQL